MTDKTGSVMTEITQSVINAMESGTAPWQRPWEKRGHDIAPINLSTDNEYHGLNSFYLSIMSAPYDCDYWVGYKQAIKLGGHVRKGEKSTPILSPMMRKGQDKKTGDDCMYISGFRASRVFNAKQCDGLTLPSVDDFVPHEIDADMLDSFIANTGADITHGETDQACYAPSVDQVRMPAKDQFLTPAGYYGTVLHELTHWTGHHSRLDRKAEKNRRGYAFEELIAELGSYYASIRLNCPNESENHTSYLESWLKALQSDPKYLWQAASAAERAANFLIKGGNGNLARVQS